MNLMNFKKNLTKQALPICVLALALALRIPLLNGSFWLDEAAQALESSRPLKQQLDIIPDFQPPLLHLILHGAIQFTRHEWWLRTVGALIPGLITIAATYFIGKRIFNKKAGTVASFLLATSSFHIFYSQELRPYSLPAMFATLSWLFLINPAMFFKTKIVQWMGYGLLTTLGLYSSYLYPFLFLSQAVYIILFKRGWLKSFLANSIGAALAFAPWLPTFLKQLKTGQQLRQTLPGWEEVVSLTQFKALPLSVGKFLYGVIDLDINFRFAAVTALVAILTGVLLVAKIYKKTTKNEPSTKLKQALNISLIWFLVPLITAWLVSFVVPVVRPKRLLLIQPGFYLIFGVVIASTIQAAKMTLAKTLAITLLILLTALNISSIYQYYSQAKYQREDWRSLHQEISVRFPENQTIVIFSFDKPFAPWRWYNQGQFDSLATGRNSIDEVDNLNETFKPIYDYQYVLVFDYLRDLTDPENQVLQTIESYGYQTVGFIQRPGLGFVRIYSKERLNT